MSTQDYARIPSEIFLIPHHHSTQPDELTEASDLFYSSGALSRISTTSSLPDISTLNLGFTQGRLSLYETLSRGTLGSVHRGCIEVDRGAASTSASASPSFVIKLVFGENKLVFLEQEAIIYHYAKHLQGTVLPRCYGFYENENHTIAFILLEDCGMPYGPRFEAFPDKTKLEIMQALKRVHDSGIEHGDLHPWNVLNCHGSPRIVDWHLAMVHGCQAKDLVLTEEFCCREGIPELACEELVAIGERMMFRPQDQISTDQLSCH